MKYWIFRCNTEFFDLDGKLSHPGVKGSWKINRHRSEIHAGHTAFIWQSRGKKGSFSGIRAVCSIDSDPEDAGVPEDHPDRPFDKGDGVYGVECQVWITYLKSDVYLLENEIKKVLPNLSTLVRPWNGTNFDVEDHEAEKILQMIDDPSQMAIGKEIWRQKSRRTSVK